MESVVVTGISSGIGYGITKVLAAKGLHVFGSVRKEGDKERLRSEFGDAVTPLVFDVTDEAAVQAAAQDVREHLAGSTLRGLVNNSGISVVGPLQYLPVEDFRRQLEINLIGPLIATQAFLPLLGADRTLTGKPGRIVNISSVGGKLAFPFLGAYHASKFGLEGFSETLRRELMIHGIDVIVVRPGSVATAIWDKAESADYGSEYASTEYAGAMAKFVSGMIQGGRKGYPPERIGQTVWKALTAARPRTAYEVVPQALQNWVLPQRLPKRTLDRMIAKQLGLSRE